MSVQQILLAGAVPVAYATWNASDKSANCTLSGGNLTAAVTTPNLGGARATIGKSSGKWYWEVQVGLSPVSSSYYALGLTASGGFNPGQAAGSVGYQSSGGMLQGGSVVATGATYAAGDVIGFAFDATAGTLQVFKNNASQYTFTGITGTQIPTAFMDATDNSLNLTARFGATAFTYSPPSGFNGGVF